MTTSKTKGKFKQPEESNSYKIGTEALTVNDKLKILEEMGKPELIDVFKEWKPRAVKRRRSAPLDQRVAITVTDAEKVSLDAELRSIKAAGEKITASQFIRNRALGIVDIQGWRERATAALEEVEAIAEGQNDLRSRKRELVHLIDEEDDPEEEALYEQELVTINRKLDKIVARNEKRRNRLTGRMSMAEAETVKWRAQRLCVSSSDYLRMMIFALEPDSTADGHLSLDAKRRFYISVMDVADNGWGDPPTIYNCSQCGNYVEEIEKLRDRIKQIETFV